MKGEAHLAAAHLAGAHPTEAHPDLHGLRYLHAHHDQKLPLGFRNADILELYRRAAAYRMYPPDSYMMKSPSEYFAMTASVYLHRSAAREPYTRESLVRKQPVYARWLSQEFGVR